MPFSRASSLDRNFKCYGGEVLERGADTRSVSTKIAADWGTMVHHWVETGEVVAINARTNLVPLFKKKLEVTGVRREQWWPHDAQHEVALAVKPFEAYAEMVAGTKVEKEAWKASLGPEWATGTMDGRWWMFDVLNVDDTKTGRWVSWEDYEEQQRFYALGTSRVLDYRGPVHATLTHWPRYPVDNRPERFGRVIEQDELLAFEKRLVGLRDGILRAREDREKLKLTAGDHCVFCPARMNCELVGAA